MQVYTESQARQYLERINFPCLNDSRSLPRPTLDTLRQLVAGHLQAIPFENLSLHYSTHRRIDLNPQVLFDKFVIQKKGGYCMEQNGAFSTLLRTLGYQLYTVGGRVLSGMPAGQSAGLAHMASIITIDGIEYLVDVGYGANCLTAPLPIFDGKEIIETPRNGVIPEQHRIQLLGYPNQQRQGHKIWTLQLQRNPDAQWETQYIFEKDFEFLLPDYEMYVLFVNYFDIE